MIRITKINKKCFNLTNPPSLFCFLSPTPSPLPYLQSHPTSLLTSVLTVELWGVCLSSPLQSALMRTGSALTRLLPPQLPASSPTSPPCLQKPSHQKEERTGSDAALRGRKGLDIIYLYLHHLLLGGERGGSRG